MVGVTLVGVGLAVMLFLTAANTTLQLTTDPSMRGRVMAVYGLVLLGSTPIGGPLLGWICSQWGARTGVAFGGIVTLAAALGAWRSRAWRP
jgi:MFS family permease